MFLRFPFSGLDIRESFCICFLSAAMKRGRSTLEVKRLTVDDAEACVSVDKSLGDNLLTWDPVTGKSITEFLLASFFRARFCYAFAKSPKKAPCGAESDWIFKLFVRAGVFAMSGDEIACLQLNSSTDSRKNNWIFSRVMLFSQVFLLVMLLCF